MYLCWQRVVCGLAKQMLHAFAIIVSQYGAEGVLQPCRYKMRASKQVVAVNVAFPSSATWCLNT